PPFRSLWAAAGAESQECPLSTPDTKLFLFVGVAGATASKALAWMHEQGIIGYFSGKNGVGMRIFLNRANSSIGVRNGSAGKKILAFHPASHAVAPASAQEAAFNDSFAVKEISDQDLNPPAPKTARTWNRLINRCPGQHLPAVVNRRARNKPGAGELKLRRNARPPSRRLRSSRV
ncbi:MAG: hypothetical protein LC800_16295, partial [Acidobacteria bacterium]|nr:hypothetical protein [Acidobacteriota bacterium]